jgi:LmbE family N-acetylglucosaminyl deacetylase
MSQKILVVSAHVGDEILGCGGTLARHVRMGDAVRVVILGEGWTSRTKSLAKGLEAIDLDAFEDQARRALAVLSISDVCFHRLPDNRFDQLALLEIVKIIEGHKAKFRPDIVYTNTVSDLGVDQYKTCAAVMTAFRPLPDERFTEILAFEIRASTEWGNGLSTRSFLPNCFIDIAEGMATKLDALRALGTEVRTWPHSRSIEAVMHQARIHGASVGLDAAEAFTMLRSICRVY